VCITHDFTQSCKHEGDICCVGCKDLVLSIRSNLLVLLLYITPQAGELELSGLTHMKSESTDSQKS